MRTILIFLEGIYRFFEDLHHRYYRWNKRATYRVGARVVSVGNITWGGTGKTPMVIMLAKRLHADGKRVCVLTRGYGNDESQELKKVLGSVPVMVGRDRVLSANRAIRQFGAEIIIMDDGFQHLRLHRDLDIVTINSTNPFGNQHLIPTGVLREPMERLSRATVFVLTQSFLGKRNLIWIRQKIRQFNPKAPIFEADHKPLHFRNIQSDEMLPLTHLKGKSVATLTGIEDPISFERSLGHLGAHIGYSARFADHHAFTAHDVREVLGACQDLGIKTIVTTEKDSWRLQKPLKQVNSESVHFLAIHIELRLDDEEGFVSKCLGEENVRA